MKIKDFYGLKKGDVIRSLIGPYKYRVKKHINRKTCLLDRISSVYDPVTTWSSKNNRFELSICETYIKEYPNWREILERK